MLTIERNNRDLAQSVDAQDKITDGDRRGCTHSVEKITSLDQYAQAVDHRIKNVDNLIHGEMSTGRRALDNIASEMRGRVAGPDNYNIGSPGGGEPSQNVQCLTRESGLEPAFPHQPQHAQD